MELASNNPIGTRRTRPLHLAALQRWLERYRAHRRRRWEEKTLSQLSDHLLRDIGCEDRITRSVDLSEHRSLSQLPGRLHSENRLV